MTIDVLVCHPDGTQTIEKQEVADNWYDPPIIPADPEDDRDSILIDHEYRLTLIELGV